MADPQPPAPPASHATPAAAPGQPAPPRDTTPRRAYKLKPGKRHFQDGQPVEAGDEVMLTQDQARAFADKFEPVDEKGEFKSGTYEPYVPKSRREPKPGEKQTERQYGLGEKETTTHGQPVQTPPVAVPEPAGAANQLPKDITALDPAKQGQQSTETRAVIDSGGGPVPVVPKPEPPKKEEQKQPNAPATSSTPPATTTPPPPK